MEDLNEGIDEELKYLLPSVINSILKLLKEIRKIRMRWENYNSLDSIIFSTRDDFRFSSLSNYFSYDELLILPEKIPLLLGKLLAELSVYWRWIWKESSEDKFKIVEFVNEILSKFEKDNIFTIPKVYRDMIFLELGIDHLADLYNTMNARDVTLMMIEKLLLMK